MVVKWFLLVNSSSSTDIKMTTIVVILFIFFFFKEATANEPHTRGGRGGPGIWENGRKKMVKNRDGIVGIVVVVTLQV